MNNLRSSRGFVAVLTSNILMVIMGLVIAFALPKIIGSVEGYGYWQLYYFYSGYYGLMMFGFNDGINLLYAGKDYKMLDKKKFSVFFFYVLLSSVAVAIIASIIVFSLISESLLRLIALLVIANIVILNITGFTLHINQITLRFKEYARINTLERVLFVAALAPVWLIGGKEFIIFIILNLFVRILVMIYGIYTIRDLIKVRDMTRKTLFKHRGLIRQNIYAGFPLTIGTIFAMLIATSSRVVVERSLDVYYFGLFSFAFAALSVIAMIIAALSTVLYPTLKTVHKSSYEFLNKDLKLLLSLVSCVALTAYFFVPMLVTSFFSEYSSILNYLFLLFPWVIYQSIGSILNDVFFRLLRMQKKILLHNVIGLAVILAVQFVALRLTGDLRIMLGVGLLVIMLWAHGNDLYIRLTQGWRVSWTDYVDILMVGAFLSVSFLLNPGIGMMVYLLACAMIIYLLRNSIKQAVSRVRSVKQQTSQQDPEEMS